MSVAEAQSPEHEGRTCTREMAQGGTRCFLRRTVGPRRREDGGNMAESGSKLAVFPRAHVLFVGGVEFHMRTCWVEAWWEGKDGIPYALSAPDLGTGVACLISRAGH